MRRSARPPWSGGPAAGILLRIVNDGSRLANGTSGQGTASFLARRAARRARDAAATLRREDVAVRTGSGQVERSHRFTLVSGRVDRESVKGTFGLSLSWRNRARREAAPTSEGPLAVMRLHLDLHVPRLGRDLSCHRAFFFGSVAAPPAAVSGAGEQVVEHGHEDRVIDLRGPHDDLLPVERTLRNGDGPSPREPLFAHNPVIESEPIAVVTREPRPAPRPNAFVHDAVGSARPAGARDPEPVVVNGRVTREDATRDAEPHDPDAPLPEGWHPDPAGHAELRYWDGHRWTAHISTGGRLWLSPIDAPRPGTHPVAD